MNSSSWLQAPASPLQGQYPQPKGVELGAAPAESQSPASFNCSGHKVPGICPLAEEYLSDVLEHVLFFLGASAAGRARAWRPLRRAEA